MAENRYIGELPGLYFDGVRGKYFPITSRHQADLPAPNPNLRESNHETHIQRSQPTVLPSRINRGKRSSLFLLDRSIGRAIQTLMVDHGPATAASTFNSTPTVVMTMTRTPATSQYWHVISMFSYHMARNQILLVASAYQPQSFFVSSTCFVLQHQNNGDRHLEYPTPQDITRPTKIVALRDGSFFGVRKPPEEWDGQFFCVEDQTFGFNHGLTCSQSGHIITMKDTAWDIAVNPFYPPHFVGTTQHAQAAISDAQSDEDVLVVGRYGVIRCSRRNGSWKNTWTDMAEYIRITETRCVCWLDADTFVTGATNGWIVLHKVSTGHFEIVATHSQPILAMRRGRSASELIVVTYADPRSQAQIGDNGYVGWTVRRNLHTSSICAYDLRHIPHYVTRGSSPPIRDFRHFGPVNPEGPFDVDSELGLLLAADANVKILLYSLSTGALLRTLTCPGEPRYVRFVREQTGGPAIWAAVGGRVLSWNL